MGPVGQTTEQHIFRDDSAALIDLIEEARRPERPTVVAIDGVYGSGKSTLARHLKAKTDATHVELDLFLPRDGSREGIFVEAINWNDLQKAIDTATGLGGIVVIEGVCVLDVLDRLHCAPDLHIYVRKMSTVGLVCDLEYCGTDEDRAEHRSLLTTKYGEEANLHGEVLDYHERRKPHLTSNAVYERTE